MKIINKQTNKGRTLDNKLIFINSLLSLLLNNGITKSILCELLLKCDRNSKKKKQTNKSKTNHYHIGCHVAKQKKGTKSHQSVPFTHL